MDIVQGQLWHRVELDKVALVRSEGVGVHLGPFFCLLALVVEDLLETRFVLHGLVVVGARFLVACQRTEHDVMFEGAQLALDHFLSFPFSFHRSELHVKLVLSIPLLKSFIPLSLRRLILKLLD